MTREKALEILGIHEGATQKEIQTAYAQRFTATKSRITNSPELKDKLEASLDQCKEAMKFLSGAGAASNIAYPSAKPVKVEQTEASTEITQQKISGGGNEEDLKNARKWRGIFLLSTIFSLATAGLFFAFWKNTQSDLATIKKDFDKYESFFNQMEPKLQNQEFEIINKGEEPFYLMGYQGIYLDQRDTTFKKYPANEFKLLDEGVEISRSQKISDLNWEGNNNTYDGKVLFYSFLISNKSGSSINIYTGVVSKDNPNIKISPNFN